MDDSSSEDDKMSSFGRSQKSILKELCAYDPITARDDQRLAHNCYLQMIGVLNRKIQIATTITDESTELMLEYISFVLVEGELLKQRSNDLVFEDHFNMKILEMVEGGKYNYENLQSVCSKYETPEGMKEHEKRAVRTYQYFKDRGFTKEDALATAFALAFYTGSKSERINRAGSILARVGNGVALQQIDQDGIVDAGIILYYMVRGLSTIPYYWGTVSRACQLTDAELECYKPGYLVSWLQCSSSKKGSTPPDHFRDRNTIFIIYSLTGRSIRQFSNFDSEDEVLFLPHSAFIVVDHQVKNERRQHFIYMRQVELGLSQWSVLWVDDHIFEEDWENKAYMEQAAARDLNKNIHFIPKSTTENAISFLKSTFGQRLKNRNNFRIVTDMNRTNERMPETAGARFIKQARQLGFLNKCLVFTSIKETAHETLKKHLSKSEDVYVYVTVRECSLLKFICFEN